MDTVIFTDEDLSQIKDHGLTVEEVQRHLKLFNRQPPYLKLLRPCAPKDGIRIVEREEIAVLTNTYAREALKGRCLKFVPSSGAASRMFTPLLRYLSREKEVTRETIESAALASQEDAKELLRFIDGTRKFAFFKDLKSLMSKKGLSIETLMKRGEFTDIIRLLLGDEGLGYANLPKALLKFHRYTDSNRTAFEEHLVEAANYVSDQNRRSALHFTVSQEHIGAFGRIFKRLRPVYEQKYQVSFQVTFSTQKRSTDTLAVDPKNRPFRKKDGRLVFRPGGHGSLIENLNDLKGDIIFAKNIDNVVPDRLKPLTFEWKKILGGCLVGLQNQIFSYMKELSSGAKDPSFLAEVEGFLRSELFLSLPAFGVNETPESKRKSLMTKLDRPIRVCGMVKNEGEPGGGPFWVEGQDGEISCQIVETAQIDPDSKEQQETLASSTHFNPVDLVCGVSDWQGRAFDLRDYVDPNAVLISHKSQEGRELKALEHPGLWNGSMARWITLFVEVPLVTFNPVKTVNDLLRREHQPE